MHRVVSLTSGPHEKLSPFILHQPSRSRSGREGRAPCARGLLPAAAGRPAACLCTASLRASPPPYRRRAPLHCGSSSLRTRPASPRLPSIRLPAARVRPPPLSAPLLRAPRLRRIPAALAPAARVLARRARVPDACACCARLPEGPAAWCRGSRPRAYARRPPLPHRPPEAPRRRPSTSCEASWLPAARGPQAPSLPRAGACRPRLVRAATAAASPPATAPSSLLTGHRSAVRAFPPPPGRAVVRGLSSLRARPPAGLPQPGARRHSAPGRRPLRLSPGRSPPRSARGAASPGRLLPPTP
ncbi:hypothetical protein PVAP13_2NG254106 [Panicum virgatum]|uniref:Uncharacterized protein n=1 Tax=Panicum virgatum TaxID=38727 RepID=A0A8T0VK28_PANVG|nr:hypothetical protein PVAP13_2NG254106 [Panicum virgatum]